MLHKTSISFQMVTTALYIFNNLRSSLSQLSIGKMEYLMTDCYTS